MKRIVLIDKYAAIFIGNPGIIVMGAAWWQEEERLLIGVPFFMLALGKD